MGEGLSYDWRDYGKWRNAGSIGVNISDESFATKIMNTGQILAESFGIRDLGHASNIHNKGDITADIGIESPSDTRFVNDG